MTPDNIGGAAITDDADAIIATLAGVQLEFIKIDRRLNSFIETEPHALDAARVLVVLNRMKREFSTVYDTYAHQVMRVMGSNSLIEFPDGTTIEKKGGVERKKWHHPELAARVADRLSEMSVDMDTGEVIFDSREMVVKLLEYAAVSYWRVGKLGELGINPDAYCEQGEYKTNIIIREAK